MSRNKNKKKFKKRFVIIPIISIIIIGGIIAGVILKNNSNSLVKVVRVDEIQRMSYFSGDDGGIYANGNLMKGSVQNVKSEGEVKVSDFKVKKGDNVKKGDVLLEYDIDSLKLNVETQKTQIDILSNNIKIAENQLAELKKVSPSEENNSVSSKPQINNDEIDNTEEETTEPFIEPDIEEEVFEYPKLIDIKTEFQDGDGSESSPYVFYIGDDTIVSKEYMQYLSGIETIEKATERSTSKSTEKSTISTEAPTEKTTEKITEKSTTSIKAPTEKATEEIKRKNAKYALFNMCDENGNILYSWFVNGAEIENKDIKDWQPSESVVKDENGSMSIKQGINTFATLITYIQDKSSENEYKPYIENNGENFDDSDISDYINDNVLPENSFDNYDNSNLDIPDEEIYTKEELNSKISEAENSINDLKFQKRQAEIDLKKAQKELEKGKEVAVMDGIVTYVSPLNKEHKDGDILVSVSNDNATKVVCALNENDINAIYLGAKATVSYTENSGDNAVKEGEETKECEGTVSSISDELSESAELDVSGDDFDYYDVEIVLDENISTDSSIYVTIDSVKDEDAICLENMFIRYENGKAYVMAANENNILEKRYVELGKNIFGAGFEIKSGIKNSDKIALPYGVAVDGATAIEVSYDEMYGNLLF